MENKDGKQHLLHIRGGGMIAAINGHDVIVIDGVATVVDRIREDILTGCILRDDLTTVPTVVVRAQGQFAHGATLREAQSALRRKLIAKLDESGKIAEFCEAIRPDRSHTAQELSVWHGLLTGSCEQGRVAWMEDNDVAPDSTYTAEQFFDLVQAAYGGAVIDRLRGAYREAHS